MAKNEEDYYSELMINKPPKVETLVQEHMVQKALSNTRRYNIFHPSAWGSCLRKIAYQYYNEKHGFLKRYSEDVDLRLERVFDNGHGVHARWQKYLAHSGVLRGCWQCPKCGKMYGEEEKLGILNPSLDENWSCACGSTDELIYEELHVESEAKYNFAGHVDAVIDLRGSIYEQKNDFDLFVVDFKTMKDDLYSSLKQAKHEHVVQVNIYMWILDIKGAVVVYENKDNQQLKEMFVGRDDKLINEIKRDAEWLVDVLRHNRLPHRPPGFSQSGFPCRFCEFRKLCFA